jgi:uncharacterized protein
MPALPVRPDLGQLRNQAKDLLRAARAGDPMALARVRAVADRIILASAQLAIAREHGFRSWAGLVLEVRRRAVLDGAVARGGDLTRLTGLLAEHPELARTKLDNWRDHRRTEPLAYVAMLRFDHRRLGLPADLPGTGAAARALVAAGARVDGDPDDPETPLITAASYGDVEVARVLVEAGAALEARAAPHAGGVPGGTALTHAAVFGMTAVLDLLVRAGARIHGIEEAAAAGDLGGWLTPDTSPQARVRALVMAADHERLTVIDQLVAAGTPVDAVDQRWGRQAMRVAVENGRRASVTRLLEHGAAPHR